MTNTTVSLPTSAGPALITVETDPFFAGSIRVTVETLDFRVLVRGKSFRVDGQKGYFARSRAYGAVDEFNGKTWSDRESALVADAARREGTGELTGRCPVLARHQREGIFSARRGMLEALPVLAEALAAYGMTLLGADAVTARWWRNAGCSMCSCSPGFVLSSDVRLNGVPVDLHFG